MMSKYSLHWKDFETNMTLALKELREDKDFFDVTLVCDDNQIQAHKIILSACSAFFRNILRQNPHQHPLLYMKGVKYKDILGILNFMYSGEVQVAQEDLKQFLEVSADLKVKGLTQNLSKTVNASSIKRSSTKQQIYQRSKKVKEAPMKIKKENEKDERDIAEVDASGPCIENSSEPPETQKIYDEYLRRASSTSEIETSVAENSSEMFQDEGVAQPIVEDISVPSLHAEVIDVLIPTDTVEQSQEYLQLEKIPDSKGELQPPNEDIHFETEVYEPQLVDSTQQEEPTKSNKIQPIAIMPIAGKRKLVNIQHTEKTKSRKVSEESSPFQGKFSHFTFTFEFKSNT